MRCKRFRDMLEDWLDGELNAEQRAGWERHLGECPGCARTVDQRRALGTALRKTLHESVAGLHFQPRPLGGLAAFQPAAPPPFARLPRAAMALAACAVVALLFLFQPWVKPLPQKATATPPIAEVSVSDSLDIAEESVISGCSAGLCYSIELQISTARINDPA